MDAADRAELERLRRRVFGPEGDVSPATLARWEALETTLHAELAPAPDVPHAPLPPQAPGTRASRAPAPSAVADAPESPVADITSDAAGPGTASSRTTSAPATVRRVRGRLTALARGRPSSPHPVRTLVTLVAVVIALFAGFRLLAEVPSPEPAVRTETVTAREAFTIVRDRDIRIIERIPPALPSASPDAPWFATSGVVSQSSHLATMYGWEVWTAVADGAIQSEACLSVRRESVVRGRCVPAVLRDTSALVVDLPYGALPADLRPDGMTDQERLGFWWAGEPGVYVVLAPVPDAAPR